MEAKRKKGIYERFVKRPFDFICALLGIIVLSPVLILLAVLVRVKLGGPVIFKQKRPGLNEKIFTLYKFRSMTDEKDDEGNLLPDDVRLTRFGAKLRDTSLDELPELFNILKGDMSIVGPRPQLVRDMVFMSDEHRKRHLIRPGLTGLAQISGRNAIDWESKLNFDIEYMNKITFIGDLKIILGTVSKVFRSEGITEDGKATSDDYGVYLLKNGRVSDAQYNIKLQEAHNLMQGI